MARRSAGPTACRSARSAGARAALLYLADRLVPVLAALLLAAQACSRPSPEPYLAQLQSRDPQERLVAANALLRYGDEVTPRLIEEYESELIRVRFEVVKLLGRMRDQRAVPMLIKALGDHSSNVAQAAAWSLGELGSPEALGPLLGYTGDASKGVRSQVIRALGTCHSYEYDAALSDSAHQEVLGALHDGDADIRIRALVGLSEFGYRDGSEQIIRMSRDQAPEVRHVAVQSLGQIALGTAPEAPEISARMRDNIVEALIAALDEVDYQSIRTKAVKALEQIGDPRVIPHLERLHREGSEEDRRETRRVLEKLRGAGADRT